jgi:hypothetical protein
LHIGKKNMDNYTDMGIFADKQAAIDYRNRAHRLCSYHIQSVEGGVRLWVKLPIADYDVSEGAVLGFSSDGKSDCVDWQNKA